MNKNELKKLIDVASKRVNADLVISNCRVVDVYNHKIIDTSVAICGKYIAGLGEYTSKNTYDAEGRYLVPGFIDSHIHIESSYVSPEEIGRLLVPHGTTTIIADPHEIVNVCGIKGFKYMLEAAKNTKLDIKFMLPSCVPATPYETSGAVISSQDMKEPINYENVLGLGEFMNYPGIINSDDETLNKLVVAYENNKIIDGHSPGLEGANLNAYTCANIRTDHECSSISEFNDRISRGLYVLLRQGSACHDLKNLLPAVNNYNSRYCLFCSDDRHPKTILEIGHLEEHLKMSVNSGLDPITAIQMATINAAECYSLKDRGAIAPGKIANFSLLKDLKSFEVVKTYINGELVSQEGMYLPKTEMYPIASVKGSFDVKNFNKERLRLKLKTNSALTIYLQPGGVLTKKKMSFVKINEFNEFIFDESKDIVKVAVVERHKGTGNTAVGLLEGYGLKKGAIAQSIAHDSHNIIVVGTNDDDMFFAVNELINQDGGVIAVENGKILSSIPMPIAGLMSDKSGEIVREQLISFNDCAFNIMKINKDLEPIMTLCFMSLAVIPEIKLTDRGLFDVTTFEYIDIN